MPPPNVGVGPSATNAKGHPIGMAFGIPLLSLTRVPQPQQTRQISDLRTARVALQMLTSETAFLIVVAYVKRFKAKSSKHEGRTAAFIAREHLKCEVARLQGCDLLTQLVSKRKRSRAKLLFLNVIDCARRMKAKSSKHEGHAAAFIAREHLKCDVARLQVSDLLTAPVAMQTLTSETVS